METRTPDLLITNQLLYQLSYAGLGRICLIHAASRGVKGKFDLLKSAPFCSLWFAFCEPSANHEGYPPGI